MTACVNRKHTKKVAAVVTASLVGALSLGAAPVAAVADTGVDMLVAGDIEDVAGGKVTAYTDQDGRAVSSTEFTAGNKAQYLKPTEVTTKTGQVLKVDGEDICVKYYKADESGSIELPGGIKANLVDDVDIKGAGTYYAGVYAAGANNTQVCLLKFTIVNKSLQGVIATDGSVADDTTIEYTGKDQQTEIGFFLNGKQLSWQNDFLVTFYKKGATTPAAEVTAAGDYVARLTGQGDYAGSTVDVAFSVEKLDLATAAVELNNSNAIVNTPVVTAADLTEVGELDGTLSDFVKLEFVSASNGALAPNTTVGAYTYKLSAKNANDANIVNSQEITVIRYEKTADIKYDNAAMGGDVTDFDASKISVKGGDKALDYDIVYTKDGKVVSADEAKLPGTYTATVTVADDTYEYGGTASVTYTVSATSINGKDVFVTYNGKVTGSELEVTYNGSDFLSKFEVSATDADGKDVPEGELILKATKDGEEVSEIVNAGTYKVKVAAKEGSMYSVVGGDEFTVVVAPITATKATVNGTVTDENGSKFLPYTGSVINPTFTFEDKDGNVIEIPAEAYKVSYVGTDNDAKDDTEVKEVGNYKATFSTTVDTVNYAFDFKGDVTFTVTEAKSFADVANDSWYVGPVYQAKVNGYINGYSGTALYGPERSISRADVVCVLFNMANGEYGADEFVYEGSTGNTEFPTDFSDCDETAYYAGALAWAAKAGVVNGYDDGTFKPEQTITREEFACMLANFAKLKGDFQASADADATLAAYDDASTVSDWATENVAWAVESDIMGNGGFLNANGDINRAEVAAMAVNYQPEKL